METSDANPQTHRNSKSPIQIKTESDITANQVVRVKVKEFGKLLVIDEETPEGSEGDEIKICNSWKRQVSLTVAGGGHRRKNSGES